MKTVLLLLIRFYRRYISPMSPPCCRFYPTCSTYALQAVTEHGVIRGGFLALFRFLKCHPLHPGGYDPVPLPKDRLKSMDGGPFFLERLKQPGGRRLV